MKYILITFLVLAGIGLYCYTLDDQFGSSAVNTRFMVEAMSEQIIDYSTTTLSYMLNGDADDRLIEAIDYYFYDHNDTIVSGTTWTMQSATSTNRYNLNGNTNYVLSTVIATTSPYLYVASTTPGLTSTTQNRIWKSKTYLNFLASDVGTTTMQGFIVVKFKKL